ncbi:MAG: SDR family oxidoreductase [Campylobacteraceae bacterium]|nr:SDR family oxidoreductase [Campylobacteraceae bacterium]
MKIAIIGGTGLLGKSLVNNYLSKGFEVKSFSRSHTECYDAKYNHIINFAKLEEELSKEFSIWKPNILVNTIALVNLKKCEDNYELAYSINVDIAKKLSLISIKFDSYFIHISTDHFYNDLKIKHKEDDEVLLLNNYSVTKRQAEKEVLVINKESLIVRTNIIGFRMSKVDSFFEWLLKAITKKEKIQLFSNFYTSPISVYELGNILLKCYKRDLCGIYNISSSEVIDKLSFGIKTANKFGLDSNNISSVKIENFSQNELKRALTLGLDISKIENILNIKMPTIDDTLETLFKEYKDKNEQQ